MGEFNDIDFFRGNELIGDPYPYFDFLRGKCPVQTEPNHGVVMVTGYDEAVSVYTNTTTFSSCNSVTGPFPGFPVPLEGDDVSELIEQHRDELPFSDQLTTMDPPKHKAHRGLLMRLITPKRLRENEDFMWRHADRQIDEFVERGQCEFIRDFAGPFTLYVIADLLGVPEEDHAWFREELQGGGRQREQALGSTGSRTMSHSPLEFLYERLTTYVEERRREPREDVLTGLATATFPDGSLPEPIDVVRVAANVFSAGQETTVRLLGSALQMIGERPDIQQRLRDDPTRIPEFVEECLRFESPVKGDFRLARTTATVGGVDVPAGTCVMVLNGAAGRDPRRFDQPDEFRMDRANAKEHLAFGRGPHACPGGPLARAETRISIERLLGAWATSRSRSQRTVRRRPASTTTCRRTSCAASPVSTSSSRRPTDPTAPSAPCAPSGGRRRPAERVDHEGTELRQCFGGSKVGEPHVDALDVAFGERSEVVDELWGGASHDAFAEAPPRRRLDVLPTLARADEGDLDLERAARRTGQRAHLVESVHDADVDVPPVGVGGDQLHGPTAGAPDDDGDPVQRHGLLLPPGGGSAHPRSRRPRRARGQ